MARKGLLVSDPQVQRTSRAQWIWEFMSLQRKERSDQEFFIKGLKQVLIHVLGLNLAPPMDEQGNIKAPEDLTEEERERFTPAALIMGNHHLPKKHIEEFQKQHEGKHPPVEDDAYEALAKSIVSDEGDMVPIPDPLEGVDIAQVIREKEAQALGVIFTDSPPLTDEVKLSEAPKKRLVPRASIGSIEDIDNG